MLGLAFGVATSRAAYTVQSGINYADNSPANPARNQLDLYLPDGAAIGSGVTKGFQCRLDKTSFRSCASPRKYWVGGGSHSFRLRPLYPSGRPGPEKLVKLKVEGKHREHKKHRKNKGHKRRH